MPILDVEIVLREGESIDPGLAGRIAEAAASIFESAPGRTWVKIRPLSPSQYSEDAGGPPTGVHPVFVTILKGVNPGKEQLANEAIMLAQAIASVCGRPSDNVHILYEPEAQGRIAFGGRMMPE